MSPTPPSPPAVFPEQQSEEPVSEAVDAGAGQREEAAAERREERERRRGSLVPKGTAS